MRQLNLYVCIRDCSAKNGYPVESCCDILHVSRGAYYKWLSGSKANRQAENERERYYCRKFTDRESLVKMVEDYIKYYNGERLQRNLGVLTPLEKHEQFYLAA